jgi:hypothetical protein
LIDKYRSIEAQATAATKLQLHALEVALRKRTRRAQRRLKTSIRAATAR